MPRTMGQNYRRKANTFRQHIADYRDGKRKRPPRVKYGTTVGDWRRIATDLGLDPKLVYDDHMYYQECVKEATRLRIPVVDALSIRWEKYCVEVERVDKVRKESAVVRGAEVDEAEIEDIPSFLDNPEAKKLANVLLTKLRSKES